MSEKVSAENPPFKMLGGEEKIRRIAERFYDFMADEPELEKLHELDESGRVSRAMRDRFALFLIGWLGGPQEYMAQHGHPRLRMRHSKVPVNTGMRDAWIRCMQRALDAENVTGPVREHLDQRFTEVADFLRNMM